MANDPRLKIKYKNEYRSILQKELGIKNLMSIPNITKIVINTGLGEAKEDKGVLEEMARDISILSGQKPVYTISRVAISNFKLKKGIPIGLKVTLRGNMMWHFLDRLISIVLPRIKDFRGLSTNAFDGKGNYALGIKEHTVFPEVDTTKVGKIRSLQVIICTNTNDDSRALKLLGILGLPFQKKAKKIK